ncbi:MAG: hypothetical protein U1E02_43160 [Hydrogenophaga sp.]|nr:hypothetical protein [Hydrogenophaga sp.]
MSTKSSIKWRDQEHDKPGFHLWDDCFETLAEGDATPVYLQLEGVPVTLQTQAAGATSLQSVGNWWRMGGCSNPQTQTQPALPQ